MDSPSLQLFITIYKDTTGVDFREWVEDGNYKGWSKKGVRVPYKDLAKSIALLKEMQQFMAASGSSRPSRPAAAS